MQKSVVTRDEGGCGTNTTAADLWVNEVREALWWQHPRKLDGGIWRMHSDYPARKRLVVTISLSHLIALLSYHHTDTFSFQRSLNTAARFLYHFLLSSRLAPSMSIYSTGYAFSLTLSWTLITTHFLLRLDTSTSIDSHSDSLPSHSRWSVH